MPTLRNRTTKPGNCIRWRPHPKASRPSTYQITNRAMNFLRSLGYTVPNEGDEAELDDDLCRPLRILGDLHFEDEESPGNVELTEVGEIERKFGTGISVDERAQLKEYIESHPRLTDDKRDELAKELKDLEESIPGDESDGGSSEKEGLGAIVESFDDEMTNLEGESESSLSDLFSDTGGGLNIPDDVKPVIKDWQPPNVSTDYATTNPDSGKEVIADTHPAEFEEEVADVPGFTDSLREFRAVHEQSDFAVRHVRVEELVNDPILQYRMEDIMQDLGDEETCEWDWWVKDMRRAKTTDTDFQMIITASRGLFGNDIEHQVSITNQQFTNWHVIAGDTEVTGGAIGDELDPDEYHRILHDRCSHLSTVEDFLNSVPGYQIDQAAEWGGL